MAKATVLVASPNATGSTPVASGSSVPAWPAFCARSSRRTAATACAELIARGLSRTSQPCTGSPRRLRAIVVLGGRLARGREIALHLGPMQQLGDPARMVEGGVELEGEARREAELDFARDEAAQIGGAAAKPGQHLGRLLAGERHHESDGVA